jgi:hypothetical protein
MNSKLNAQFHGILGKMRLDEDSRKAYKLAVIWEVSKNRVSHWNDLTDLEAQEAIKIVNSKVKSTPATTQQPVKQKPFDPEYEAKSRMKKKLLAMGYDMKWDVASKPAREAGCQTRQQINFFHVDLWCKSNHSIYHKGMDEMTVKELADTVSQMERVKASFLKSLVK